MSQELRYFYVKYFNKRHIFQQTFALQSLKSKASGSLIAQLCLLTSILLNKSAFQALAIRGLII